MPLRRLVFPSGELVRLGGLSVSAHLLVDRDGLTLIDTGLWGVAGELKRVTERLGRRPDELRNIVLTHGHLDHTGGAAEIQAWSGARIWVHEADREHVGQTVRYTGSARACGALERLGAASGGGAAGPLRPPGPRPACAAACRTYFQARTKVCRPLGSVVNPRRLQPRGARARRSSGSAR